MGGSHGDLPGAWFLFLHAPLVFLMELAARLLVPAGSLPMPVQPINLL
jgi:hypothetical protein